MNAIYLKLRFIIMKIKEFDVLRNSTLVFLLFCDPIYLTLPKYTSFPLYARFERKLNETLPLGIDNRLFNCSQDINSRIDISFNHEQNY